MNPGKTVENQKRSRIRILDLLPIGNKLGGCFQFERYITERENLFVTINLLPHATKVLSETEFPDTFRTAFFEHLKQMHAQLLF